MSTVDFLRRAVRHARLYASDRGRRRYARSPGPLHHFFALVANRMPGLLGAPFRAAYTLGLALLKINERCQGDRINFDAQVAPPLGARALSNAGLWQGEILAQGGAAPVAHVNLHVRGAEPAQIDGLFSVLLLSESVGSISIFFDEVAAHAARHTTLTLAEESRAATDRAFDLNVPQPAVAANVAPPEWSSIFSSGTGFGAAANHYLKVAHPGAFIVALSLPEAAEGFCQLSSLQAWSAAVHSFQSPVESLSFVVLNPIPPEALATAAARNSRLGMARTAGLSLAESIRVAQLADAYVGPMDIFGLAAWAAHRPGVYLGAEPREAKEVLVELFAKLSA